MVNLFGAICIWGGLGLVVIGWFAFVLAAFREDILWGLGVLFLPFVSLIFLVLNWSAAKHGFFLQLLGIAMFLFGALALAHAVPWEHHHRF